MTAEMMKAENELQQKMQEIRDRWPHLGIILILKAVRETVGVNPEKVEEIARAG